MTLFTAGGTFENAAVGMIVGELRGLHVLQVNRALEQMLGYTVQELRQLKVPDDITHPDDRAMGLQDLEDLSSGRESAVHREKRLLRKDGGVIWVRTAVSTIKGPDGTPKYAVAMIEDITVARQTEEALRESQRLLRALIDNSTAIVYVKDLQGRYLLVNRRYEELFGVPGQSLVGKTDHDIFPKDRADAFRAFDSHVLAAGTALEAEETAPHDDGPHTYISLKCPLFDSAGESCALCCISTDITERKLSEQRQQLMMQELDHRVKNNLAAVISLVDITWRSSGTVDAFRNALIGRIQALARAHELLAQTRWSGLPMDDLVRRTLEAFLGGTQRLSITGPPCTLPARAASPLCMTLHELATNAAKYGALSSPSGHVDLQWSITGPQGAPTHIEVRWQERGGPSVTPPKRKGFGISLVENVIGYQLDGDVTMDFAASGLVCTMTIDFTTEDPAHTSPSEDASSFLAH